METGLAALQAFERKHEPAHGGPFRPLPAASGASSRYDFDADHGTALQYRMRLVGQYPEELQTAYEAFSRACAALPDHAEAVRGMARVLYFRGEKQSALRYLDQIVERSPEDVEALVMRGITRCASSRGKEGVNDLKQAIARDPGHLRARSALALEYLKAGQSDLAEQQFDWLRAFQPTTRDEFFALDLVMKLAEIPQQERWAFSERFVNAFPMEWLAYLRRAHCWHETEEFQRAIADLNLSEKRIRQDSDLALVLSWRSVELGRLGDWASALREVNRAIELDPDHALLYAVRRECHEKLGDFLCAQEDRRTMKWFADLYELHRQLESTSEDAELWTRYAEHLLHGGRWEWSLAAFGQALQWAPQSEDARLGRKAAQLKLGRSNGLAGESPEDDKSQGLAALRTFERKYEPRYFRCFEPIPNHRGELTHTQNAFGDQVSAIQYRMRLLREHPQELREAYEAFSRAAKRAPDDLEVLRGLARAKFYRGEKKTLLPDLNRLLDSTPEDAEIQFMRGLLLCALSDFEGGIANLQQAIAIDPRHVRARCALTAHRLDAGRTELAKEHLDWFLSFEPASREEFLDLAFAMALPEIPCDRALAFYERLMRRYPGDWQGPLQRSIQWRRIEQPGRAIADLNSAEKLFFGWSHLDGILFNRAQAYAQLGQWEAALRDVDRAIELEPDGLVQYGIRYRCRLALGDTAGARADQLTMKWLFDLYRHHRELDASPEDGRLWIEYAELLLRGGRARWALAASEQALELDAKSKGGRLARIEALIQLGRFAEAVADCTEAIEWEPSVRAFSLRGDAQLALNRLEAALADFQRSGRFDREVARAWILLARQRSDADDFAEAQRAAHEAVRLDPDLKDEAARILARDQSGEGEGPLR